MKSLLSWCWHEKNLSLKIDFGFHSDFEKVFMKVVTEKLLQSMGKTGKHVKVCSRHI